MRFGGRLPGDYTTGGGDCLIAGRLGVVADVLPFESDSDFRNQRAFPVTFGGALRRGLGRRFGPIEDRRAIGNYVDSVGKVFFDLPACLGPDQPRFGRAGVFAACRDIEALDSNALWGD